LQFHAYMVPSCVILKMSHFFSEKKWRTLPGGGRITFFGDSSLYGSCHPVAHSLEGG
jgi:hypothetical protein